MSVCRYQIRSRSGTAGKSRREGFVLEGMAVELTVSLGFTKQRHEVQPDVYCKRLGLPVPISVSVKQGQTADLWVSH